MQCAKLLHFPPDVPLSGSDIGVLFKLTRFEAMSGCHNPTEKLYPVRFNILTLFSLVNSNLYRVCCHLQTSTTAIYLIIEKQASESDQHST